MKTQHDEIGAPASEHSEPSEHRTVFMEPPNRLFTLPALIASKQHKQTRVIYSYCQTVFTHALTLWISGVIKGVYYCLI